MSAPRLLELFARAQGSAVGYARAGFQVTASDIDTYDQHPEVAEWITADSMAILADVAFCRTFDLITGGPPCQRYTKAQQIRQNEHPDLLAPVREALLGIGVPFVLENVPGAPMINPVAFCGCMFADLNVYRERWFEAGNGAVIIDPGPHHPHLQRQTKMGRPPVPGERIQVVGNFSGAAAARLAMGIDWMTRDDLREAIPPAYTHWIGSHLIHTLRRSP